MTSELDVVIDTPTRRSDLDFNRWSIDFLADYIYNQHHQYHYAEAPVISELLQKVYFHHGSTDGHLRQLVALFRSLQNELNVRFKKEENVLFPRIKQLVKSKLAHTTPANGNIRNIQALLQQIEDHTAAGDKLLKIRELTNNYTVPANACNSYALLYSKLREMDADLHQHIHLENTILFPKALLLEKELMSNQG